MSPANKWEGVILVSPVLFQAALRGQSTEGPLLQELKQSQEIALVLHGRRGAVRHRIIKTIGPIDRHARRAHPQHIMREAYDDGNSRGIASSPGAAGSAL